jgi:hypothetical protein
LGVIRYLVVAGVLVGACGALYRNDYLRTLAQRAGAEQGYLSFEAAVLGTPGWGTPRALEQLVEASNHGRDPALLARLDKAMSGAPRSAARAAPAVPVAAEPAPPKPPAAAAPAAESGGAVSLDSLPLAPAEPTAAPSKPATERASVQPTRSASTAARRPAAEDSQPARPTKVKKAAVEPAAPPPRPKNDNPLKAAIRSAILKGD